MFAFYRCRKFEMYVRWKVLLGLGIVFWLLLCLSDYLPMKQIDHILKHKPMDEMKSEEAVIPISERTKNTEGNFGFVKVVMWNLVAFVSTISVCFLLKAMSNRLNIINNQPFLFGQSDKTTTRKTSSSKIPIPISLSADVPAAKGSFLNAEDAKESECNKSCPNLRTQDTEEKHKLDHKGCKKGWSLKVMEGHCAKLRDEMINLQATSLKEHASVTRKLETLLKERKELTKQLNAVAKENKSLKQQLDDMIEERTLLIRRLECATKEMKTATKNKRVTIAKLDEAVANAESLKLNLEQIKRDKIILEDKLVILDAEYKRLREEVELYREKENELERRIAKQNDTEKPVKEHAIDNFDIDTVDKDRMTQTDDSDYDVFHSEQDIKKVQEKLLTLEKSLEDFKLRHVRSDIKEADSNLSPEECEITELNPDCLCCASDSRITVEADLSTNSICTEPDCPLEHRECVNAECFLRKKSDDPEICSSGDDILQFIQYKECISLKQKIKSSISDDRLSVISERATSTVDDSSDDWTEHKGSISNSPAFQKFLRQVLDTDQQSESRRDPIIVTE